MFLMSLLNQSLYLLRAKAAILIPLLNALVILEALMKVKITPQIL